MQASLITPNKTINLEDVQDMVFHTPHGQKHIQKNNGYVDPLKKGKVSFLIQRKDSSQPETIEYYVDNGVVYVEQKVINIVTEDVK